MSVEKESSEVARKRKPAADESVGDEVVFAGFGNGTTRLGAGNHSSTLPTALTKEKMHPSPLTLFKDPSPPMRWSAMSVLVSPAQKTICRQYPKLL